MVLYCPVLLVSLYSIVVSICKWACTVLLRVQEPVLYCGVRRLACTVLCASGPLLYRDDRGVPVLYCTPPFANGLVLYCGVCEGGPLLFYGAVQVGLHYSAGVRRLA